MSAERPEGKGSCGGVETSGLETSELLLAAAVSVAFLLPSPLLDRSVAIMFELLIRSNNNHHGQNNTGDY